MATLEELVVRIKADISQLDRELKRVAGVTQQQTNKMSTAFGGLEITAHGAGSTLSGAAACSRSASRAIKAAGHINDLADRISFAATSLSALETPLADQRIEDLDEFRGFHQSHEQLGGRSVKGGQSKRR